jgi:hypothetical protein
MLDYLFFDRRPFARFVASGRLLDAGVAAVGARAGRSFCQGARDEAAS